MTRVIRIVAAALTGACAVGLAACSSAPSSPAVGGAAPGTSSGRTATGASGPAGSTSATGPATSTTALPTTALPTTALPPTKATPGPGIREVDFANRAWWDDADQQTVVLRKGAWKGTVSGFPAIVELVESKAVAKKFVDIDADGYDDALLTLQSSQGNGVQIATYAWLWDPSSNTPVQVRQRLTDDARCGDATTSITPSGASQLALTIMDGTKKESCAAASTVKLRRTVKIVDGVAMEVKPYPSARISCWIGAGTDDFFESQDLGGQVLRAAPDKGSPVVARAGDLAGWGEVKGDQRAVPKGWVLLWYLPKALVGKGSERLPCGFAQTS